MARVLVVDDDAPGLEIRKLVLERAGHTVEAAAGAERARTLFREMNPESILLDLRMPELEDGLALIRYFRAASTGIRIIVLSGWSSVLRDLPEAAMVDEILTKPVRSEQLLNAIAAGTTH
jgi:CheY-like chemotaxis protein